MRSWHAGLRVVDVALKGRRSTCEGGRCAPDVVPRTSQDARKTAS